MWALRATSRRRGPSSAQGDIYSLGKVLYEMATGRDRMDFPELPTNLQELPDRDALLELNAVLAKACARDPRERYRTARRCSQTWPASSRANQSEEKSSCGDDWPWSPSSAWRQFCSA